MLCVINGLLLLTRRSVWRKNCLRCTHRLGMWVVYKVGASRIRSAIRGLLELHHVFRTRCQDSHWEPMRLWVSDVMWVPLNLSVLMARLGVVVKERRRLRSVLHCEVG